MGGIGGRVETVKFESWRMFFPLGREVNEENIFPNI